MAYERPNLERVRQLPSLNAIYEIAEPKWRLIGFQNFFWCKAFELSLPLTREEKMLDDTFTLFKSIPREGWPSAFEDSLNYASVLSVIHVLRYCACPEVAAAIEEALELFYNGRTDLISNEQRREAGIRGFRHPSERRRFYALGDVVEKLPWGDDYNRLLEWPEDHRANFEDFARP